jgi:hypothetical protein
MKVDKKNQQCQHTRELLRSKNAIYSLMVHVSKASRLAPINTLISHPCQARMHNGRERHESSPDFIFNSVIFVNTSF